MDAAEDLPQDLVFVDLETTGGNAAYHRITEIGIVRVANGELVEEWSSLVNPECRIPPYIEAFTGISNEMVAEAPRFADTRRDGVRQAARRGVRGAQRAFRLFVPAQRISPAGHALLRQVLCTVKLSRRLFPEYARHNLDAVMERHGLNCGARHRALGDAQVLRDFWCKLRARDTAAQARGAAAQAVLGAIKLPAHLPPELADELPEGPGRLPLLRRGRCAAVRRQEPFPAHARAGAVRQRAACRLAETRSWRRRCGASIGGRPPANSARCCSRPNGSRPQKPLFNRRRKPQRANPCTLRLAADAFGPRRCAAHRRARAGRSRRLFRRVSFREGCAQGARPTLRARSSCASRCWVSRTSEGSCFAYQVGKCKGACVGKEPLILHDMRLQLALSSLKLKSWPFPGRIALRERATGAETRGTSCTCSIIGPISARRAPRRNWPNSAHARRDIALRRRCLQDAGALFLESCKPRLA